MIAEIGFENIRMRMVAERAGVSTAALHYHFDTREKLFAEALRYSFEHTGARRLRDARARGDTADRPAGPDHLRVAADDGEPAPGVGDVAGAVVPGRPRTRVAHAGRRPLPGPHQGWIEETLDDGIASGEFEPCDTAAHAQLISSLCDGFGVQLMFGSPSVTLDSRAGRDLDTGDRAPSGLTVAVPGGWPR